MLTPHAGAVRVVIGMGAVVPGTGRTVRWDAWRCWQATASGRSPTCAAPCTIARPARRPPIQLGHVQVDLARALGPGAAGRGAARSRAAATAQERGMALLAHRAQVVRRTELSGVPPPRQVLTRALSPPGRGGRYPPRPMGKTLVIAEKPSVGQDLARVLPGAFTKTGAKGEQYLEGEDHVDHVGGRPPRATRRSRRVRRQVQEVADGRSSDRPRLASSSSSATSAPRSR